MLSTQSLREHLDRYADGSLTAKQLEEWLASESWDMRRWAPRGLQRLVESMQGVFINYADGKTSADALKQSLEMRRDQLHRSETATKRFEAVRQQVMAALERGEAVQRSIAASQAALVLA